MKEPTINGPSCIVARAIQDHQLVGIFFAYDDGTMLDMIDECIDPTKVEFRELLAFSLLWPSPAIAIPDVDSECDDENGDPTSFLKDAMLGYAGDLALSEDGEWFRFTDGHVYLLKAENRYKIGYAVNVDRRVAQLRTGSPFPIEIVHYFPADPEDERRMHKWYAEYRRHGEWFELPDNIVAEIKAK